jgi:acyl-CoA thioesterase FadM
MIWFLFCHIVITVFLLSSIVESFLWSSSGSLSSFRCNKCYQHPPNDKISLKVLSSCKDDVSVITIDSSSLGFQKDEDTPVVTFTSSPIRVYIEDTDAYGIIYNTNYLRMFDRVLFTEAITGPNSKELQTVLGHDWSVVAVGNQKFVSSPILGTEVVIQGRLSMMKSIFDNDDNKQARWSVWNMEMRSMDGSRLYNAVTDLVIASSPVIEDISQLKDIIPKTAFVVDDEDENENENENDNKVKETAKESLLCRDTFRIHRDELDAHIAGQLPLRNILNYFERGRTNMFGGPNNLQRMQKEDGILAVVTSVRGLSPLWRNIDGQWRPLSVKAGDEIDVTSMVEVKRKVRGKSDPCKLP